MRKNAFLYLFFFLLFVTATISFQAFGAEGGELTVAFLDVGQGDAIYIESPTGVQMLIDGGKGKGVLRELGSVMPFSDRSIDIILATHPDQDHIGGLPFVLGNYDVSTVIRSGFVHDTETYKGFGEAIVEEEAEVVIAQPGMIVDLGGAYFEVLYSSNKGEANDASIVGRLVYGESEVMLTGDAPKWVEAQVMGDTIQSDILKAGHHGSKTSSAEGFVREVNPELVVISAGKDNRYGHPHKEVVGLFEKLKIPMRYTWDGRVVCKTGGVTWSCL